MQVINIYPEYTSQEDIDTLAIMISHVLSKIDKELKQEKNMAIAQQK